MEQQDTIYLLPIELHDDNTSSGGVSHKGETLVEFIEEQGLWGKNFEEINTELKNCGIEPITLDQIVPKSMEAFFNKFFLD